MRMLSAAALAAALMLAACGGTASTPTSPDGGATTQTLTGNVSAYGTASHSVEAARAGTLTVTLTWAGPADLDLYLTPIDCTEYPPDGCLIMVRSTASSGNREQIEWPAAANERLKIWIDNFSPSLSADYTIVASIH